MNAPRRPSPVLPFVIVALTVIVAGLTFLLPVVHRTTAPLAVHWRAAISTAVTVLFVGTSIMFFGGLKSFKSGLRLAYRLIAIGILAFSTALVQLIIWGVFDLWDSDWAASGSGLLPYVVTAGFIYFGTRKFVRLLSVQTLFNSFPFVFVATLTVGVLLYVSNHVYDRYAFDGSDVYIGVAAWCSSYLTVTTIMIGKIYHSIGAYYKPAMRWMTVGMAAFAAAAWHETLATLLTSNEDLYGQYGWYLLPWVVAGLLLLRASYEFRKLPAPGAEFIPVANPPEITDSDYIDSIVSVASLTSQPQGVDSILDELRIITANLDPGQQLSTSDKQRLIKTYNQLEDYLGINDPLRTFSKEEVLSHVTPAFRNLVGSRKTS